MNRILRFFVPPLLMTGAAAWSFYNYWIDPDPMWRYPKAEAGSVILVVIAVGYVLYNTLAFLRTSRPITPGMNVMFDVAGGPVVGRVVAVEGTGLVVQTPEGSFRIERDAVADVI